jgi:pimeloyl-ACP methyl ester carboxylesterase
METTMIARYRRAVPSLVLAATLSACGGGGGDDTPPPPPPVVTLSCAQLADFGIAASAIGLPTTGAAVTSSVVVAASGTGVTAIGEHCLVTGNILPIDPTAPNIQFRVALPTTWNSKVVMLGGGGLNGSIPNVAGNALNATGFAPPLGRGYAVFASDSGHQSAQMPNPAAFYSNEEATRNYMGDALKKTRDVALAIVRAAYGRAPQRAYFVGSSTGGREALAVASAWPADWDGVVSLYPAQPTIVHALGYMGISRAFAAPGAYSNPAKRLVLYRAALEACDALDGVSDGLISDEKRCNAVFNPTTATVQGSPLRCANGADTGDTCLSDAQLAALAVANGQLAFNFSLASGARYFPGFNVFTSDTSDPSPIRSFGTTAPASPFTFGMPGVTFFADSFVRFAIANDASFNYLSVDPSNPGAYASRFSALSALDVRGSDMSGFAAKGGKVLLMHGTSDLLVSPRLSEYYFHQLQANLGASAVDSFVRFYLVPAMGHGVGYTFNMSWDQLTALENWVEGGVDPKTNQVIGDTVVPGRTRPLCAYPTWPRYRGSGDVNSAASFACVGS